MNNREVAIIGLPDDKVGEAPAAYVVLKDEVEPSDELRKQIADMVKGRISRQLYLRRLLISFILRFIA